MNCFFDLVFVLATSGVVVILHSTPEHIVSFERILSFIVSTLSIWHVCLFENSKTVKPSWSFPNISSHLVATNAFTTIKNPFLFFRDRMGVRMRCGFF